MGGGGVIIGVKTTDLRGRLRGVTGVVEAEVGEEAVDLGFLPRFFTFISWELTKEFEVFNRQLSGSSSNTTPGEQLFSSVAGSCAKYSNWPKSNSSDSTEGTLRCVVKVNFG